MKSTDILIIKLQDGELPDHVKIPDDFRREEVQFILESIYASSTSRIII